MELMIIEKEPNFKFIGNLCKIINTKVTKMGWIRNEGKFNDDSYLIDGNIWGMKCNFESTGRGPELEEWGERIPDYVCRLKAPLTKRQKEIIKLKCEELRNSKYDYAALFGHYLGWNHVKRIRCDENVIIPFLKAGINLQLPERRPRGFMKSPAFTTYEVRCSAKN